MKIEGKNSVIEYLKSGKTVNKIMIQNGQNPNFVTQVRDLAKNNMAKIVFMDKAKLDKESETKSHQGIIADVSDYEYATVEEIMSQEGDKLIIVLDEIEDTHNLGSVIRVCECAGANGIIIPKHRSAVVNETAIKVSAGAASFVKVARVTNLNQTITDLKKQGVFVYCADMDGQQMTKTNLTGNIAIVIGSEGHGVAMQIKKNCDGIISIPMYGKINSLNASVSCGIVVYEAIRQRNNQ